MKRPSGIMQKRLQQARSHRTWRPLMEALVFLLIEMGSGEGWPQNSASSNFWFKRIPLAVVLRMNCKNVLNAVYILSQGWTKGGRKDCFHMQVSNTILTNISRQAVNSASSWYISPRPRKSQSFSHLSSWIIMKVIIANHFWKVPTVPDTVIGSLHTFGFHGSLWYIEIIPNFHMRENECQKRLNDLLTAAQLAISGRGGLVHPDLFFPKSIHLTLICLDANITHTHAHTLSWSILSQTMYLQSYLLLGFLRASIVMVCVVNLWDRKSVPNFPSLFDDGPFSLKKILWKTDFSDSTF